MFSVVCCFTFLLLIYTDWCMYVKLFRMVKNQCHCVWCLMAVFAVDIICFSENRKIASLVRIFVLSVSGFFCLLKNCSNQRLFGGKLCQKLPNKTNVKCLCVCVWMLWCEFWSSEYLFLCHWEICNRRLIEFWWAMIIISV